MLLPGGKILHKNLATYYTRSHKLLSDLRDMRFSGYLHLSFWEYEGVIIFDTGKIVQIYVNEKRNEISGHEALRSILEHIEEKDGVINVLILEPEPLMILTSLLNSDLVNKKENVSVTNFEEFLNSALNSQEMGFINLDFGKKQGNATIYFSNGSIVSIILQSEDGRTIDNLENINLLSKIKHLIEKINTSVSYFQCQPDSAYEQSQKLHDWFEFYNFILFLNSLHDHVSILLRVICPQDLLDAFVNESIIHLRDDFKFENLTIENCQFNNFANNDIDKMKELYIVILKDVMAKIEDIYDLDRKALKMGMAPFYAENQHKLEYYHMKSDINTIMGG